MLKKMINLLVVGAILLAILPTNMQSNSSKDLNLKSFISKANADSEDGAGYTHPKHISDPDPCTYTCVKVILNIPGFPITLTSDVPGSITECHFSPSFNCNASACKPSSSCPTGYS